VIDRAVNETWRSIKADALRFRKRFSAFMEQLAGEATLLALIAIDCFIGARRRTRLSTR